MRDRGCPAISGPVPSWHRDVREHGKPPPKDKASSMLRLRRAWLVLLVLTASLSQNAGATGTAAKFPPWSTRDRNALDFTVPCIDNVPDLHGSTSDPDLVVFAAGNQFMVMPDLMSAFRARHPEIKRIFYETLPPKRCRRASKRARSLAACSKSTI